MKSTSNKSKFGYLEHISKHIWKYQTCFETSSKYFILIEEQDSEEITTESCIEDIYWNVLLTKRLLKYVLSHLQLCISVDNVINATCKQVEKEVTENADKLKPGKLCKTIF